ncbi:MAG TPA: SLATT domain-containing protein [Chthoniobacterales bacterium]|jgi:SMODS and SLOG-associating 2TM effector domain 2|nr:SLATT domain-containing protein [Chthoniobacterales bacterium]
MNDVGSLDATRVDSRHTVGNGEQLEVAKGDGKSPELCTLYEFAVAAAEKNITWYRTKKKPRQQLSHFVRCTALLLAIVGGLCPLLPEVSKIDVSRYGYILLAAGGGLILFDKLFGLSSSWMRFMVAAQELEALLDSFRVDWASEKSKLNTLAATLDSDPRFQLIKDFIVNMHAVIERETNEWKAEFQKGVVHFETLLRQHSEGAGTKNRR